MIVTRFLWDNNNVVRETDEVGAVEAEYTYQPEPFGDLVSQRRATDSSFYRFDALGSTTGLTDATGAVTDDYRYQAFGEPVETTGATENPYRWVGRVGYRQEEAISLYNLRARDYDSAAGRFVSQDPLGLEAGDANFYRYVNNHPVSETDPTGFGDETCPSDLVDNLNSVTSADNDLGNIQTVEYVFTEEEDDGGSKQVLSQLLEYSGGTPSETRPACVKIGEDVPASHLLAVGRAIARGESVTGLGLLTSGQRAIVDHGIELQILEDSQSNIPNKDGFCDEFGWHRSFCMSCHDSSNKNSVIKRSVAEYTARRRWDVFVAREVLPWLIPFGPKGGGSGSALGKVVTSSATGKPNAIYLGFGSLSARQRRLLSCLCKPESQVLVKKCEVNLKDLAALTAATGDEFAMLTTGGRRLVFRGADSSIGGVDLPTIPQLTVDSAAAYRAQGWRWSAHTHPGPRVVLPSSIGDRNVLKAFGQNKSIILNSEGRIQPFTQVGDDLSCWRP